MTKIESWFENTHQEYEQQIINKKKKLTYENEAAGDFVTRDLNQLTTSLSVMAALPVTSLGANIRAWTGPEPKIL